MRLVVMHAGNSAPAADNPFGVQVDSRAVRNGTGEYGHAINVERLQTGDNTLGELENSSATSKFSTISKAGSKSLKPEVQAPS